MQRAGLEWLFRLLMEFGPLAAYQDRAKFIYLVFGRRSETLIPLPFRWRSPLFAGGRPFGPGYRSPGARP
jgi:hypothetical protein